MGAGPSVLPTAEVRVKLGLWRFGVLGYLWILVVCSHGTSNFYESAQV